MAIHDALLSIGLLIVAAKLLEGVFRRFGLNAIIGYAVAGVLLGPVTGLVEPGPDTELMLSLGIFIFFFLIGLEELDIKGFLSAIGGRLFIASTLSVVIAMAVSLSVTTGSLFGVGLDLSFNEALGLAGVLSLSSLGIVAKVLIDAGRLNEPVGAQMFTAVIIAELIALFIVGIAISEEFYAVEGVPAFDALSVATIIGEIAFFALATWFAANKALPRLLTLLHRILQVPQLSFGVLLGGLFLVVVGAEEVGLHGSLGALLFGAALSLLPYQLRHDLLPGLRGTAEGFFVPLFFASAGLHLSLDFLQLPAVTILALVLVPLAGKAAGAYIGAFIARVDHPFAVGTGLMAKGVAEIALLLLLFSHGAIDQSIFALFSLVMLVYIVVTPMGISFALGRLTRGGGDLALSDLPPSQLRFALDGVKVSDILDRSRAHPDASVSIRGFAEHWLMGDQHDYVVVNGKSLAGIVSLSMLRYVPRSEWDGVTLGNALRRETPVVYTDDAVEDALQRMTEASLTALPVMDSQALHFLGSITSHEILEMMLVSTKGR